MQLHERCHLWEELLKESEAWQQPVELIVDFLKESVEVFAIYLKELEISDFGFVYPFYRRLHYQNPYLSSRNDQ